MNESGIHIVILCSRLDLPGGIERAVVNTANLFQEKGHRVTLLILDETHASFYPINEGVHTYHLPVSFGITSAGNPVSRKLRLLSDVLKLRRTLKNLHPTLLIATEYPFAAAIVLAGMRKRSKLVSWEHHHMNELAKNGFWERVFNYTYPRLHQIVCLNPDEKRLYDSLGDDVVVIPNYTATTNRISSSEEQLILTVSRLNHVKGIDILVKLAGEVLTAHPGWKWKVIGQGRMDDFFKQQVAETGLHDRLLIQEPSGHNLAEEYAKASLYVMTSRNECFPMTLLEAMSHGLPCVAFDCETGPRHIIKDEINGNLVRTDDTSTMLRAINELINNPGKRKQMGENAIESVKEFSKDRIYNLWATQVLPSNI